MFEHRTTLLTLAICFVWTATFGQSQRQLSTDERQHILDGQFRVVSVTDDIPARLKKAFCRIARQQSFAMANPGQNYQVGDVIFDASLPRRRLIFAGTSEDKRFVHYERGGRGVGYYVVVLQLDPHGDAHFLWGGAGGNRAKNLEQLRKMVAAGQFSNTENY